MVTLAEVKQYCRENGYMLLPREAVETVHAQYKIHTTETIMHHQDMRDMISHALAAGMAKEIMGSRSLQIRTKMGSKEEDIYRGSSTTFEGILTIIAPDRLYDPLLESIRAKEV